MSVDVYKKNVLVIAAHPDDEVLGCGATIKRWVSEGAHVRICIVGEGITSRFSQVEDKSKEIQALQEKTKKACQHLDVTNVFFGAFSDNRLDTIALLDVVHWIERHVEEFQPHIVLSHGTYDLNIDHQLIHKAVLTAIRPTQMITVDTFLTFEILSSTEWNFTTPHPFRPNYFVDVSKTIEYKTLALKEYDTELRAFPHPRSVEGIFHAAAKWGTVCGLHAAEAFEIVYMRG